MRMHLLGVMLATACGAKATAPPPRTPTATATPSGFRTEDDVKNALGSGMVIDIELVEPAGAVVATCQITFDLWDEVYVVKNGAAKTRVSDVPDALTTCLGGAPTSALTVRVAAGAPPDPLAKPTPAIF